MAIAKQQTKASDAALARKHRIAMRNRHRSVSNTSLSSTEDETSIEARNSKRPRVALASEPMVVSSSEAATKPSPESILESIRRKKPHITGIKKQSRYDPGVAMTKEELKAWRKEARRVRNRESAAASRKKNREAIDLLENKVQQVQTKYETALQYIVALEDKLRRSGSSSSSFYPSTVLRQDLEEFRKVSPEGVQTVSPPESPTTTEWPVQVHIDLDQSALYQPYHPNHPQTLNSQKHIIENTIIRPIAAKISPGANEKMMSANDGNDDKRGKVYPTSSANDMVISDDDSATVNNKTLNTVSSSSDNSSYSGSDDETIIESDQPLFLDAVPPASKKCGDNGDPLLGSDVGTANEEAAMMAEFLQGTFEQPNAVAVTADVLDASEMEALLNVENDAMMLLPDLCLEC